MSRNAALLRWLGVLVLVAVGALLASRLVIRDDALDLLPDGAVRGDLQKLQQVGLVDRLFISLSADKSRFPDEQEAGAALVQSARQLGALLDRSDLLFGVITGFAGSSSASFFSTMYEYLPVLLDESDLAEIEKRITAAELERIMRNNYLRLNSPEGIGAAAQIQQDPLGITGLLAAKLRYLRSEFSMQIADGLLLSRDGRNCLVLAESRRSLTDSNNAQTIMELLERSYPEALVPGVEPRLIGTLPHTMANSSTVKNDLRRLLPVATVLLVILLAATLRSIRAVFVISVPFLAAFPAIGVTSLIFGSVSALALGFGIVLLGIGVDFAVHLYLGLSRGKRSAGEVLRELRTPVFFASMTTITVFLVLLLSEVPSHRQMATLALSGIVLAVTFTWLLIPMVAPREQNRQAVFPGQAPGTLGRALERYRKPAFFLWLIVLLGGLAVWPQLRYNGDLRVLDAPNQKVRAEEDHFSRVWGDKQEQAFVVSAGSSLSEALDAADRFYQFLAARNLEGIQTISPLVPGMKTQKSNRERWKNFWSTHRLQFRRDFHAAAQNNGFAPAAFAPFLQWLDNDPPLMAPDVVLSSAFGPVAGTMIRTPAANGGNTDEQYTVLTTVKIDDDLLQELLGFAASDKATSVLANKKWRQEVERLLKKDIMLLSGVAGICVFLLVGFQFRNVRSVAGVLAPVLSALAAMSLFCFLTDGELNMMHLIMGIMVIGLSVDYGIFVVCSRLQGDSSTALIAVSVCAVSSLTGFGVLAFASHPALHSLGVTVLTGIGASWPAAILVSPYLAGDGGDRR